MMHVASSGFIRILFPLAIHPTFREDFKNAQEVNKIIVGENHGQILLRQAFSP